MPKPRGTRFRPRHPERLTFLVFSALLAPNSTVRPSQRSRSDGVGSGESPRARSGTLKSPAVALVPTKAGHGDWLELADASVCARGDADHFGSG